MDFSLKIFLWMCFAIVIFFWIGIKSSRANEEKRQEVGIKKEMRFDYCGGYPSLISDARLVLDWKGEGIILRNEKDNKVPLARLIPYSDIISFEGMTEQQIRSDVTLGRLAVFGIFAFGMKKEEKSNKYFIVMKYNEDAKEINLVLGNGLFMQDYLTYAINELKRHHEELV